MTKNEKVKVSAFYPGFVKKAISFTIDDGNYPLDKKFIDIVSPAGITGAFNLCGVERCPKNISSDEYREFYKGYEIANHVFRHPKVFLDSEELVISDEVFNLKTTSLENKDVVYKSDMEGLYYRSFGRYFGVVASEDTYIQLIDEGKRQLEEVFGEGSVPGFVWPYQEQPSEKLKQYIKDAGYKSIRRTGVADFFIPENKMAWCYNATHANLNEKAAEYDALKTDELTFFCFGVHAHDFENNNCWDRLEAFAEKYGNRDDFYYATPTEIFDYADAVSALEVLDGEIKNDSDTELYIELDGNKMVIPAHACVQI